MAERLGAGLLKQRQLMVSVVYAVGALGVPGFGAAGISSGLSALAGGSGMLAGVAAAAATPLSMAILLGLLGFALAGWFSGPPAAMAAPPTLAVRPTRRAVRSRWVRYGLSRRTTGTAR
jgi:hypothetical protein